ncbi:MAG: hemin-degrading factor [Bacteroidia bacterium]|nr:MAG: hemin-degrading factor [Bacteroidia bacterium]
MVSATLKAAYERLKSEQPHLYLRDLAAQLGVSEGQLVPVAYGSDAVPLKPDFQGIFGELPQLGPLMGLSRNAWVVIETTGPYPAPAFQGPIGVLNSPLIDLRLYLAQWGYGYAVRSFGRDGKPLYSLQFFTPWGEAIHKVYLQDSAFLPAWEALVSRYAGTEPETLAPPAGKDLRNTPSVDREQFLADWSGLQDTHDFFALLQRYGLSRWAAVRLAEGAYAWRLPGQAVSDLLAWARTSQTPIMFFVGNAGIHHIYTGVVSNLSPARGWINILDEAFTLHLNPAGVEEVYLVEKPTREGPIYSVEVFGPEGEEVLWIFGARKPGQAVPPAWLAYIHQLKSAALAAAQG